MSLADEYRRQRAFRDVDGVLDFLPLHGGERILDLGCGVGDWAFAMADRGARVIGLDGNDELLESAAARGDDRVEFRKADLSRALPVHEPVDGLFACFVAAYFLDLPAALANWCATLRSGGFVALIEIDDLFGHEPLAAPTRRILDDYVADALAAGRYDFRMGGKLESYATRAGLRVVATRSFADREFAFSGPASPDAIASWSTRLDRMGLLRARCGDDWNAVRADFLGCLARPDHRATCAVRGVLATKP